MVQCLTLLSYVCPPMGGERGRQCAIIAFSIYCPLILSIPMFFPLPLCVPSCTAVPWWTAGSGGSLFPCPSETSDPYWFCPFYQPRPLLQPSNQRGLPAERKKLAPRKWRTFEVGKEGSEGRGMSQAAFYDGLGPLLSS